MVAFRRAFNKLSITEAIICETGKSKEEVEKGLSAIVKVRWVAVDNEKFGNLISDTSYSIAKLNELLPPMPSLLSSMAVQDLS
ncbi:hypothetical protein QBC41DRAFT_325165, partial [Cercophora samala]